MAAGLLARLLLTVPRAVVDEPVAGLRVTADVLIPTTNGPTLLYMIPGRGDGTFGATLAYATTVPNAPVHPAVGDLDGDGRPDIVVGSFGGSPGGFAVLKSGLCLP